MYVHEKADTKGFYFANFMRQLRILAIVGKEHLHSSRGRLWMQNTYTAAL